MSKKKKRIKKTQIDLFGDPVENLFSHKVYGFSPKDNEFKVNDYITLKLEKEKTNIYVEGQLFNQCKFLLLNIPIDEITTLDEIESVDEASEKLDRSLEREGYREKLQIDPKTEFWGHCSNMQVWAENNYDTRLLYRNIAFPLLEKLTKVGDPLAKKIFKDEIIKRFHSGDIAVTLFLFETKCHNYLNNEEMELIYLESNNKLKERIEDFIILFEKKEKAKIRNKELLVVLRKLVKIGDSYAKKLLNVYLDLIQKRQTIPMDINTFWKIIKDSRNKCGGNTNIQEKLLIDELLTLALEDIHIFEEIFYFYTDKLREGDGLAHLLVKNFDIFLSDDGWYYFCLGTVALGRKLYIMALFDVPKFIKELKKGNYGHPRNIEQELYAIFFEVWDILSDSREEAKNLFPDRDIRKVDKELRYILDSWYMEELKKHIEKKEPETIAFLSIFGYFEKLAKDYLVNILLDEKLFKIWIKGYFDFGVFSDQYLSKLGVSISDLIRDRILKCIEKNDLEGFLSFFGRGLFSNLKKEDFIYILKNPDFDFFKIVFEALEKTKKHRYLLEECSIFTYSLEKQPIETIKSVASIFIHKFLKGEVKVDLKTFIQSGILDIIDIKDLNPLFESKKLNLLENLVHWADKDYFEVGEWFYGFLERIGPSLSGYIKKSFECTIKNQNYDLLLKFLEKKLLSNLTREDFLYLMNEPSINLFDSIIKSVEDLEEHSPVFEYGPIFTHEIIEDNLEILSEKIKATIVKKDSKEIIAIFRLKLLEHFNNEDLIDFFDNEEILLDFIIKIKEQYLCEIEEWIDDFLEKFSVPIINYLQKLAQKNDFKNFLKLVELWIIYYIKKEDFMSLLEDDETNFFEFILNALKEKEISWYTEEYCPFPEDFLNNPSEFLKKKIFDILHKNDAGHYTVMLSLKMLDLLEIDDYIELLKNSEVYFLENLLKALINRSDVPNYDFDYFYGWPAKFFNKIRKRASHLFQKRFDNLLKTCNLIELYNAIKLEILSNYSKELTHLIESQDLSFLEKFLKALYKVEMDEIDWESDYSLIFEPFRNIGKNPLIKNKIIFILEIGNLEDFIVLLDLRWLEYFNSEELKLLFENPKIRLIEKIQLQIAEFIEKDISMKYLIFTPKFVGLLHNINRFHPNYFNVIFSGVSEAIRDKFLSMLGYILNPLEFFGYQLDFKFFNDIEFKNYVLGLIRSLKPQMLENCKSIEIKGRKYLIFSDSLYIKKDLTDITEIKGLDKLNNLKCLDLGGNKIREIKGLDTLYNLESLDFSWNHIEEINGLEKLHRLKYLNLNHNLISDIKGLENLDNLENLYLEYNKLPSSLLEEIGEENIYSIEDPQKFVLFCRNRKNE